jgi:hypothetical protein
MYVHPPETEMNKFEGVGATDFFEMDDIPVAAEGEVLDPASIIPL